MDDLNARILALLERIQFSWTDYAHAPGCYICESHEINGHKENCELVALMAELKGGARE